TFQRECEYPRQMLDANLAMDRNKIAYIAQLPNGGQMILDALNGERPVSIQRLADRFGVEDMLTAAKDEAFMASLLYYFGVLTFGGRGALGKLVLRIPNLVVRQMYVERIRELLLPDLGQDELLRMAEAFYTSGDLQPVCDFVEQRYFQVFDNRDYRWANELTIKTAFLTLLFNDLFYVMDSEPALDREYADLVMIVRPDMRQYALLDILIEFKYVSLQEADMSGAEVRGMSAGALKELTPVQQRLAGSRTKLLDYRRVLEEVYGDALRLRAYSVVSVGFDRLVWAEAA
ncbi:MAG: AAA family ATPase, partial [Chloroflexota bacterium]|nr:AAA family ATPase [Chloroflexota bacterium]